MRRRDIGHERVNVATNVARAPAVPSYEMSAELGGCHTIEIAEEVRNWHFPRVDRSQTFLRRIHRVPAEKGVWPGPRPVRFLKKLAPPIEGSFFIARRWACWLRVLKNRQIRSSSMNHFATRRIRKDAAAPGKTTTSAVHSRKCREMMRRDPVAKAGQPTDSV